MAYGPAMKTLSILALTCSVPILGCGADEAPPPATSVNTSSIVRAHGRVCGARDMTDNEREQVQTKVAADTAKRGHGHGGVINVHVHIITDSGGNGDVTSLVPAQIDVLNAAYASAGFTFNLKSVETIANDAWFNAAAESPDEITMKNTLRRGGSRALNIYTGVNDGSLLGWATFPSDYDADPKYDGVVALYASFPGGGAVATDIPEEPDGVLNYAGGDTMTHEVGHWLGLFHTFQGGCNKKGDRIDDTPSEAEPQFYCVQRDSCTGPKHLGVDPIHNFMDYVDDDCMDHFTTDQDERMRDMFQKFRAN